ncbi:metallophosphoesterase family protein [Rhizorhabdus wittichii]
MKPSEHAMLKFFRRAGAVVLALLLALPAPAVSAGRNFTIAVIPDTQTYANFRHQKAEGFPFDAADLMKQQFDYIAAHSAPRGGDIRFVAHVGDVWEHATIAIDPAHVARGFKAAPNPFLAKYFAPTTKVGTVEIPLAEEAFDKIAGLVPFGIAPGNHDYDAMWTDIRYPPFPVVDPANKRSLGVQHVGGLRSFRSTFGDRSRFFAGKPWYVASHDGGADSAQIFEAGGYRFLHIALQFNAPRSSLRWAAAVLRRYRGWPTILSTHDYLTPLGERGSDPAMDAHGIDPKDGSPQILWDELISRHDQIFLVLCGHQSGEARRRDKNAFGHDVDQLLADYQDRHQASIDAGLTPPPPLGDGWMRLLGFDMDAAVPTIRVRTYSPHYGKDSRALATYAAWYKAAERPDLTDAQFLDQSDFVLSLDDFRQRFGPGRSAP